MVFVAFCREGPNRWSSTIGSIARYGLTIAFANHSLFFFHLSPLQRAKTINPARHGGLESQKDMPHRLPTTGRYRISNDVLIHILEFFDPNTLYRTSKVSFHHEACPSSFLIGFFITPGIRTRTRAGERVSPPTLQIRIGPSRDV